MATPLAQEEYERFYSTLGGKPVHQRLATHWARLIELLYAAERWVELATDPEITSRQLPHHPDREADRGRRHRRGAARHAHPPLLDRRARHRDQGQPDRRHHQQLRRHQHVHQEGGRRASSSKGTVVTEGLLNRVEMAFRAYDPCFGCATHTLPGQMPLAVVIRDAHGNVIKELSQYVD